MSTEVGFSRILVAYDGSGDSTKAVRIACAMSKKFGSELTMVHVYSSPMMFYGAGPAIPIPDYKGIEEAAKATATDLLSQGLRLASDEGVKAKGEILQGQSVVEALSGYAAEMKADLLVVGTRGMTGFKKLIVGSVSAGLVGHSPCPVMVVR